MKSKAIPVYQSVSWGGKAMLLLLAVAMLIPLSAISANRDVGEKIQPALLTLVRETPQAQVRVILQTKDEPGSAQALVEALGGNVVQELRIINAVAAEISAAAARKLASHPAVRWISLDGPVDGSGKPSSSDAMALSLPTNTYLDTLNVRDVWALGYRGQGIGIAVIDSGVSKAKDLQVDPTVAKPTSRVVEQLTFNSRANEADDVTGHGTLVAGIIGGSGYRSNYLYTGVAPEATFLSLKVSDDAGMAYESDVVAAMQWVYDNREAYAIRVVNVSLNSTIPGSYHNSPMNAAAEILWFNGIVVVASAGNSGGMDFDTINSAPANDPFIMTVGATDENGTSLRHDDTIAAFSARGITYDGHMKPELYAPGKNIISLLSEGSNWDQLYPSRTVLGDDYFRLSGTSLSAPMVTGAVALLLQAEPQLTPDQVKYRLMNSAGWVGSDRYLDVHAAVTTPTTSSANTGLVASQLLWTGDDPAAWDSVSWNSVSWNSVSWNSVSWNSVSWNSVSWNSVSWNN